jgi:hypothetical protein
MKDIAGYEGLYAITSCGKVWSHSRKRFRKLKTCKSGYVSVGLRKGGDLAEFYVHRLVAEAYIPNPNNWLQVIHKDGNIANNHVNNLEWCLFDGYDAGDVYKAYSNKPVYCVELNKTFSSISKAAKITHTTTSHIRGVCEGKKGYKTAGGYHWKYV